MTVMNLSASRFAESLGVTAAYLSRLMRKKEGGGDKLWRAIRRTYPGWEPYLRGEINEPPLLHYRQEPEFMSPRRDREAPDSGPGQMRLPSDLSEYRVVKVLASEEGQRRSLHHKLDEILNSGDPSLILAITCNIEEFEKAAKDRRLIAHGEGPPKDMAKGDLKPG